MPLPPPRDPDGPYRVCLVCLGNICRSPMAEVVLRAHLLAAGLAHRITVDSAGTGEWHVGQQMNSRARAQLARRGYDGEAHRARQFSTGWFPERDLVLAMDSSNYKDLATIAKTTPSAPSRLALFGDVTGLGGADIPDPYGGNPVEFARVLDLLESAMPVLVAELEDVLGPSGAGPVG
jgi:protein-tyrosine phosphatase